MHFTINSNLAFNGLGDNIIVFQDNWSGTISVGTLAPHIGIVWGKVKHLTANAPEFGETVLTAQGYNDENNPYYIPLQAFCHDGTVINSFVFIPSSGRLKVYYPDNATMTVINREYHIWGIFYV